MQVQPATPAMYDEIRALDKLLPGVRDRAEALRAWLDANECWVAHRNGQLAGFAIANCTFFAQFFIVLVVVHPDHRRHGVASALIRHLESRSPTAKVFTSTNQSNVAMQAVSTALGFVPSGTVENLDEDDPELIYFKRVR